MNYSKLLEWSRPLSAYEALSGGVNAWGLGGMGSPRRGGFGGGGSTGSTGGPFFNINPTTLANFKAAWVAQSANVPLVLTGDSTMRGVDELSSPYGNQYSVNATPMQLAALLNAGSIKASADNLFGSGLAANMADLANRDNRFTYATLVNMGSTQTQGGASFGFSATGQSVTVAFKNPVDNYRVWFRDAAAGRNLTAAVDGAGSTAINTTGVSQIGTVAYSAGTLGLHNTTIAWALGTPDLFAIEGWDSTKNPQILVRQWGASGDTSAGMIANVGTPNGGRTAFMNAVPPKLVISECGLVNDRRNSVSLATSYSQMTTYVANVKATGSDFLFLTPPYDNSVGGLVAEQDQGAALMYQIAREQNVGVIDLRRTWRSYAYAVSQGWQRGTDNVHPATAGYLNTAQLIYQALRLVI